MNKTVPQVTVSVVFHNEEENLFHLLETFKEQFQDQQNKPFCFQFIDNNSKDNSIKAIKESWLYQEYGQTEIVHRSQNHMGEARQQALLKAQTPWVLFLDADTLLQESWVKSVLRVVEGAEEAEFVIGGGEEAFGERPWHEFAKNLANYFPMGKMMGKKVSVSHVPTNNCLLRRERALAAGGFKNFFGRVGEDLDFSVRIRKQGKIIYDPSFPVRHRLPATMTAWFQKMALYGRAQSYVLLENRGGVPYEKFFPLALLFVFLWCLKLYPIETGVLFTISVMIPRTQFFILSFMFYGLGELVGCFRFFLLKMSLRTTQVLTGKTP